MKKICIGMGTFLICLLIVAGCQTATDTTTTTTSASTSTSATTTSTSGSTTTTAAGGSGLRITNISPYAID